VVSVSKTELILWSISGLEGTLKMPKQRIPRSSATAVADLNKALATIVSSRYAKSRPETSHEIILMADRATTIQDTLEIAAAMRTTADGSELFRDIMLSSGFE
jgi:hypothetical protein